MLTEEELEFARVVRDLVDRSVPLDVRLRSIDAGAPDDAGPWQHLAAMGLFELAAGLLDGSTRGALVLVLEELGRQLVAGPFVETLVGLGALAAADGPDAAALWTELSAGDRRLATVLDADVRVADGRISGRIGVLSHGASADVLVVVAADRLAVVAMDAPGVRCVPLESFDLTLSPASIELDDVVPRAMFALPPGVLDAVATSRTLLGAALQVGAAAGCLDRTIEYARDRFQFGLPIGSFQAVKHPLADLFTDVELARALLHATIERTPSSDVDAAMAMWAASTALGAVAVRCIQLHGGIGMTWEHPMHLYLRRAQASAAMDGAARTQMAWLRDRLGDVLDDDGSDIATPSPVRRPLASGAAADPATWASLPADALGPAVEVWVRDHLPAAWLAAADADDRVALAAVLSSDDTTSTWFRQMGAVGLTAPDWPSRYGGLGLDDARCAAIGEVLGRYDAGVPSKHFTAVSHAGPTVLVWGSDDLRDRLLPCIVDGRDVWCQMFSEPGAGSDLAGLATRARRDGDTWRIDGQKVWTSYARESQYAILLARSDPDLPKHRGLIYFVLDMSLPGIDIRPIRQITGASEFNEVFLDGVVVPDAMRLGEPGEGWRVAVTTLMAERTGIGKRPPSSGGPATALLRRAVANGWTTDGAVCERLLELVIRERAIERLGARGAERSLAGEPGPEGSITKIVRSELAQRVAELGQVLEGEDGAFWPIGEPPTVAAAVLGSRLGTIAGGTSEILRNVLAERVLGLPKDAGIQAATPWSELRRS